MRKLVILLVLALGLAAAGYLVIKNQETRRGAAVTTPNPTFSFGSQSISVGESVVMIFGVDTNNQGKMAGVEMIIKYDNAKLRLVNVMAYCKSVTNNDGKCYPVTTGMPTLFENETSVLRLTENGGTIRVTGVVMGGTPVEMQAMMPEGMVRILRVVFEPIVGASGTATVEVVDGEGRVVMYKDSQSNVRLVDGSIKGSIGLSSAVTPTQGACRSFNQTCGLSGVATDCCSNLVCTLGRCKPIIGEVTPPVSVSPTAANLPCVTVAEPVCSASGNSVRISWNALPGAISYALRVNKNPYNDWFNSGAGDQYLETTGTVMNVSIIPGGIYQWDIEGLNSRTGNCRGPFNEFSCPAPSGPTITAIPLPTYATATGTVVPTSPAGSCRVCGCNCVEPGTVCTQQECSTGEEFECRRINNVCTKVTQPVGNLCQTCLANGDALTVNGNCDGVVNLDDFSAWLNDYVYYGQGSSRIWKADFDCNGKIEIADFSKWLTGYLNR